MLVGLIANCIPAPNAPVPFFLPLIVSYGRLFRSLPHWVFSSSVVRCDDVLPGSGGLEAVWVSIFIFLLQNLLHQPLLLF